ncbi:MAG: hypothetical protein H6850_03825 [Alphaproteobacteria bacterium]|nr:MAG: hypothetical protein H6850_03825 [Alphaproteobacteria bacterium]
MFFIIYANIELSDFKCEVEWFNQIYNSNGNFTALPERQFTLLAYTTFSLKGYQQDITEMEPYQFEKLDWNKFKSNQSSFADAIRELYKNLSSCRVSELHIQWFLDQAIWSIYSKNGPRKKRAAMFSVCKKRLCKRHETSKIKTH